MVTRFDRNGWDREYAAKGRLWGGSPHYLPDLPAGTRVLELGCGSGRNTDAMLSRGWTVTAVDFSRKAIAVMSRALPGMASCNTVLADARLLPFSSGSFDLVFAVHVLGHLDRSGRQAAAAAACDTVKAGGRIVFLEFSTEDFRYGTGTETEPGTFLRGSGIRTHYFTINEARALFSGAGIEKLETRSWALRIRGRDHLRSEIFAILKKPGP